MIFGKIQLSKKNGGYRLTAATAVGTVGSTTYRLGLVGLCGCDLVTARDLKCGFSCAFSNRDYHCDLTSGFVIDPKSML